MFGIKDEIIDIFDIYCIPHDFELEQMFILNDP